MSVMSAHAPQRLLPGVVPPYRLSHVALQTPRLAAARDWYVTVASVVPISDLKKQGTAQGNNLVGTSLVKPDYAAAPVREWKSE